MPCHQNRLVWTAATLSFLLKIFPFRLFQISLDKHRGTFFHALVHLDHDKIGLLPILLKGLLFIYNESFWWLGRTGEKHLIHGKFRIVLNFIDSEAYYLQSCWFSPLTSPLSSESLVFLCNIFVPIQELPMLMKLLSVYVGSPFSALSCTEALICFK